jgi:dienelactone hydrolase
MTHSRRFLLSLSILVGLTGALRLQAAVPDDPLFDLKAIMTDPVDYVLLEKAVEDGIVFEMFEYTSRVVSNTPERVKGIFAYPEGGQALPAVYWSMGGMAPAGRDFPRIFANKGYACAVITLQKEFRQAFRIPFDTAHPETANLTLLARDQLRGITVLSQRPQVDSNRMAVAGASYGGVYATLIAGVDPRIKAGFSFFGAGNHSLGSNLPQFSKMKSLADVEVWNRTIDPAFRLKKRAIPFMWGVAFNDNWFYFPAVAQTFMEAAGTEKRMVIVPHWQHGFLPTVDQALCDFLDTAMLKTRPAYNAPGPVKVFEAEGRTFAEFTWSGDNPVTNAVIVASYGEPYPWLGWQHRACFILPATVAGRTARAPLPIPSRNLPLIVWGTVTDNRAVPTSTPPLTLRKPELALLPVDRAVVFNTCNDGEFDEAELDYFRRHNTPLNGVADLAVKHSGLQSLRLDPPQAGVEAPAGLSISRLLNVPGLAHRLGVWVRAAQATEITVTLTPVRPTSWRSEVVCKLLSDEPLLAPLLTQWQAPCLPILAKGAAGPEWSEITLDVPMSEAPVEGYKLDIRPTATNAATWWVDSLRMQPIWPE